MDKCRQREQGEEQQWNEGVDRQFLIAVGREHARRTGGGVAVKIKKRCNVNTIVLTCRKIQRNTLPSHESLCKHDIE